MSYCGRGKARLSSLAGRNVQFRSDWSAIWVYNPRNGILMQHGFEESGDVQDIRLVVDTIPTLAWSAGPDGSADFVNRRWLDYTGLSAKQALGSGWQVAIHPDDLPRILETLQEALNSVKAFEVEGRFRRFDGEFRWFLFRGSPLRDRSGKVAKWYGTNTDIEERKRAEDALLKSEERWRSVFENSAIGVALSDLNGRFLATNHVYQTIVGYTEEELRAVNFLDVTHEDYRQANWALITELVEGKRRQFQIEKKYRRKDGSSIWVSNNVSLVPGSERVPRFIMALSEDITHRKRAEEALQRSEAYLAEAQKLTHTGSWVWNVRTDALFWSQEVFRIYDYDPEKMARPTWDFFERVHPEDRPKMERRKKRMASTQKEWADSEIDFRIVLPDGTIKHLHSIAHPAIESGDEVVGTVMDVTEQWKARAELENAFEEIKQRTEALRRSEAYLAEAQKLTHTGSWAVRVPPMENAQGEAGQGLAVLPRFGWDASYWSKEMYRIFGLDPDPTPPSYMEVVRRLHPEDARYYTPAVEQAIRNRTDFETDFRLLLPNGTTRYIHAVGHPVVNASGDVIELVGTAMDVTERKQAEEKIREQEVELRQILDAAPQHLSVLRSDGSHLYINQSSLDFLGLTLEEWQKRDIRELVHPDDAERVVPERKQALSSGSPLKIEARFLRYDGEYRWLFLYYKPLRDQLGRITRGVVPAIAIDDRKRSEERLHLENVALREEIVKASMFEEIVGTSPALQAVIARVSKVAPTDSAVLITGETGTGKELIARAIHKRSRRSAC